DAGTTVTQRQPVRSSLQERLVRRMAGLARFGSAGHTPARRRRGGHARDRNRRGVRARGARDAAARSALGGPLMRVNQGRLLVYGLVGIIGAVVALAAGAPAAFADRALERATDGRVRL